MSAAHRLTFHAGTMDMRVYDHVKDAHRSFCSADIHFFAELHLLDHLRRFFAG